MANQRKKGATQAALFLLLTEQPDLFHERNNTMNEKTNIIVHGTGMVKCLYGTVHHYCAAPVQKYAHTLALHRVLDQHVKDE